MPMKHAPEPWESYCDHGGDLMRIDSVAGLPVLEVKAEIGVHDEGYKSNSLVLLLEINSADLGLILAAPTAPHECDDPKCPGNVNRLKLEAFPGLLQLCKRLVGYAEAVKGYTEPGPLQGGLSRLIAEARTAIAKAEPARE